MTKTKTRKELKAEFSELMGKEATVANVRKKLTDMGMPLPTSGDARCTQWWQEVIETIWKYVRAWQKASQELLKQPDKKFVFLEEREYQLLAWDVKRGGIIRFLKSTLVNSSLRLSDDRLSAYVNYGKENLRVT